MPQVQQATQILRAIGNGDHTAADRLLPLIYDELHALAARHMERERPGHTLQPTALVHEAYLRLIDQTQTDWKDRTHFLALASEMIRRILVDHARTHRRLKRGGDRQRVSLEEADQGDAGPDVDLLAIDEALDELGRLNQQQHRVVELRFFGGLSIEETAAALGVGPTTVKAQWRMARAWLAKRLEQ